MILDVKNLVVNFKMFLRAIGLKAERSGVMFCSTGSERVTW